MVAPAWCQNVQVNVVGIADFIIDDVIIELKTTTGVEVTHAHQTILYAALFFKQYGRHPRGVLIVNPIAGKCIQIKCNNYLEHSQRLLTRWYSQQHY